jgi:hypothetical protein
MSERTHAALLRRLALLEGNVVNMLKDYTTPAELQALVSLVRTGSDTLTADLSTAMIRALKKFEEASLRDVFAGPVPPPTAAAPIESAAAVTAALDAEGAELDSELAHLRALVAATTEASSRLSARAAELADATAATRAWAAQPEAAAVLGAATAATIAAASASVSAPAPAPAPLLAPASAAARELQRLGDALQQLQCAAEADVRVTPQAAELAAAHAAAVGTLLGAHADAKPALTVARLRRQPHHHLQPAAQPQPPAPAAVAPAPGSSANHVAPTSLAATALPVGPLSAVPALPPATAVGIFGSHIGGSHLGAGSSASAASSATAGAALFGGTGAGGGFVLGAAPVGVGLTAPVNVVFADADRLQSVGAEPPRTHGWPGN